MGDNLEQRGIKRQRLQFRCDVCGKTFTKNKSLLRHIRSSPFCNGGSSTSRFQCTYDECALSFSREEGRRRHEREVHQGVTRRAQPQVQKCSSTSLQLVQTSSLGLLPSRNYEATLEQEGDSLEAEYADGNNIEMPWQLPLDTRTVDSDFLDDRQIDDQMSGSSMHSSSCHHPAEVSTPTMTTSSSVESSSDVYDSKSSLTPEPEPACPVSSSARLLDTNDLAIDIEETTIPDGDQQLRSAPRIHESGDSNDEQVNVSTDKIMRLSSGDSEQDVASVRTMSTISSTVNKVRTSFDLPFRLRGRKSLIRAGASARPDVRQTLPPCPFCHKSFECDYRELKKHLDQHFQELQGDHKCVICEVGFTHEADLNMHLQSAKKGHCGFDFEHTDPCAGHHLPETVPHRLSDSDRFKLQYWVKDWDLIQLQAFCVRVDEVLEYYAGLPADSDCWSIGALLRRSGGSVRSVSTLASRFKLHSTPDHVDYQAQLDIDLIRLKAQRGISFPIKAAVKLFTVSQTVSQSSLDRQLMASIEAKDTVKILESIKRGANLDVQIWRPEETIIWLAWNPVTAAICAQDVDILDLLVANGANVNCHQDRERHDLKNWAVAWAVHIGDMEILACLLRHGAEVDESVVLNGISNTLLGWHGEDRFIDFVRLFIEYDIASDRTFRTLATVAVQEGWKLALESLLRDIPYQNSMLNDLLAFCLNIPQPSWYPHCSIAPSSKPRLSLATVLVDHGADVHGLSYQGHTALFQAAATEQAETCEFLLEHGVHVISQGSNGQDLLAEATENNLSLAVKYLFEAGVKIEPRSLQTGTLLACAVLNGNTTILQHLIDHGADMSLLPVSADPMDDNLKTFAQVSAIGSERDLESVRKLRPTELLVLALLKGRIEMLFRLMRNGINLDAPRRGRDELQNWVLKDLCDRYGSPELIAFFTLLGGTSSAKRILMYTGYNLPEESIVQYAIHHGLYTVIKYLLEHTETSVQDLGSSLIHAYRRQRGSDHDLLMPLLDLGVDIDQRDQHGCTTLAWVIYERDLDTARKLIYRGADVNCLAPSGLSALAHSLDVLSCLDDWQFVDLLLQHGAVLNHQDHSQLSTSKKIKLRERMDFVRSASAHFIPAYKR